MTTFWKWLKDYWYIPFFILAVVLGWVIFRKRSTPIEQIQAELEAIRAGRKIREMEERDGAVKARIEVLARYAQEKKQMTEAQQAEAERLKDDPVALAKFLVRAGATK